MSHSPLATYVSLSPNHSGTRRHKVDTITPHYMAGNLTIETCAQVFKPTSRKASSNYGIGSDGRIGVYVEEENRAWTSSSAANDQRAITIECANLKDGSLTDGCWASLVALCADVCKRYGYEGVYYCGSASYSRLPDGYMLLTMHKWFADTDCPGPWLSGRFTQLAHDVNVLLQDGEAPASSGPAATRLDVDGYAGPKTIRRAQEVAGTRADGEVSNQPKWVRSQPQNRKTGVWKAGDTKVGSDLVRAIQKALGVRQSGLFDLHTWHAFEEHFGITLDYEMSAPSHTIKCWQKALNKGKLL